MKSKMRYLLLAVPVILIIIVVSVYFSFVSEKNIFIKYASEHYGVAQEDITVLSYKAKEKRLGFGAPIPTPQWRYTPAWITLQVDEMTLKLTTTSYDTDIVCDDYFYDELYDKINKFCAKQLGVGRVLFSPNSSSVYASGSRNTTHYIAGFLENQPISTVDDTVVIQFLTQASGTPRFELLVPTKGIPTENDIKRVIDHLVQIDDDSKEFFSAETMMSISFVDSIENIVISRNARNDGRFDDLYFRGHEGVHTYCTIYPGEKGTKKRVEEYNVYCYSAIKEPKN